MCRSAFKTRGPGLLDGPADRDMEHEAIVPNQFDRFVHANQTRKAGFPAPRVACLLRLHKTDSWSTQVASIRFTNKRRIGTIQSFRPGYAVLMPQSLLHGKISRHDRSGFRNEWQGQQGSNPRPAVLETAALPTELYP